MSKKNVSITSKENDEESLKRGSLSHIDDAIDQTPITKIAKNASLEHPKAIKTEAFATKKHGFDILDEAINKTPITKIVKDGYESKKLEKNETIPYYRYVKTDQDVLESVIMAEFNLTEEMAKALSTEIRTKALQLKNSSSLLREMELPSEAPELYDNRKDKSENAPLERPVTTEAEAFAAKKRSFDILDEAINNTPITKIVKDGYESKKHEKTETIPYYRYVKTDQDVLKSVFMTKFNLTEEDASATLSRLTKAFNYKVASSNFLLPNDASEKYEKRSNKTENALEFLNRVWGRHLEAGVLYRDHLVKLDPKLLAAVRSYCQNRKEFDVEKILPPEPSERLVNTILSTSPNDEAFNDAIIKLADRIRYERKANSKERSPE